MNIRTGEYGDGGGLASSIVAQESSDLTLIHVEIQTVHCQLFSFQQWEYSLQVQMGHSVQWKSTHSKYVLKGWAVIVTVTKHKKTKKIMMHM